MISEIAKRPTLRVQNFSNLGRRANKRVFSASFLMLIITATVATLFGHPKVILNANIFEDLETILVQM